VTCEIFLGSELKVKIFWKTGEEGILDQNWGVNFSGALEFWIRIEGENFSYVRMGRNSDPKLGSKFFRDPKRG